MPVDVIPKYNGRLSLIFTGKGWGEVRLCGGEVEAGYLSKLSKFQLTIVWHTALIGSKKQDKLLLDGLISLSITENTFHDHFFNCICWKRRKNGLSGKLFVFFKWFIAEHDIVLLHSSDNYKFRRRVTHHNVLQIPTAVITVTTGVSRHANCTYYNHDTR